MKADAASLTARHALVGVCCLYDFGFVSSRLFVDLIRRVAGLSEGSTGASTPNQELSDYRVELLVLLLRLGGAKLRQDDALLFAALWKDLQDLIEAHQGASGAREIKRPTSGAEEPLTETGRLALSAYEQVVLLFFVLLSGTIKSQRYVTVFFYCFRGACSTAVCGPWLSLVSVRYDGCRPP